MTTRELEFKRRLVLEANLTAGQRVLDVGCGTGTLALMLKEAMPDALVTGVDGDIEVVKRAREKARSRRVEASFGQGLAGSLAFQSGSFDLVVSSLVFHHLDPQTKRRALEQIRDLLRPAGRLLLADIGGVPAWMARSLLLPFRLFDGLGTTADNFYGRLPEMIRAAGFREVTGIARYVTPVGPVEIIRAIAPTKEPHG
ncbi:MAG: class I SAM-dependent methyltransferase [Candidatus Dormibacteria bacterium]